MRVHFRRHRAALPAHVARTIGPSPARAEPHDAASWLPVPDPHGLPSIETLLEEATPVVDLGDTVDLAALEAAVAPSPARAEPHDAAAWLPLPDDVDDLPSVDALLDPDPEVQAAVVAEAEAVVADALAAAEASSAPSPARAEPHDAAAWLPLPSTEALPSVTELLEDATPPPGIRRRLTGLLPGPRVFAIALLVVATVLGGGWAVTRLLAPAGSQVTLLVDGSRHDMRTEAKTVGALLKAQHVQLGSPTTSWCPPRPAACTTASTSTCCGRSRSPSTSTAPSAPCARSRRSAENLAKQLKLGKLTAVRNQPGRLAAGSTVVFRTRISGSLKLDNQSVTFDSPSRTVDELLQSYNVHLRGDDFVVPAPTTVLVGRRDGHGRARRRRRHPGHAPDPHTTPCSSPIPTSPSVRPA